MKRKLISISAALAVAANAALVLPGCALASADEIKIIYDGAELELDSSPQIINDTTLVPMRAIFEAFGAKVKWDGDTQNVTAKKKSKTISMTIGSEDIVKNDKTIKAQTPPQIIDGRTMVPVRAISELLGLDVDWNGDDRTVIITTPDDDDDDSWKDNTGTIDLGKMTSDADGVSVDGNVITITKGGDYSISGKNSNASILINARDEKDKKAKVKLRLNGMELTNPNGAAIYAEAADKLYITIEDGTDNVISDGAEYADEDINACIFSKDDVEIKGKGNLTVNADFNHGIRCNDSLEISNGNITINAENDGIHVNDTLLISGGTLNVTAKGDGISSDEIIDITDGVINVTTTGAVASDNNGGMFMRGMRGRQMDDSMLSPSPAPAPSTQETADSSKGIKSGWMTTVNGGTININSTDHALHSTGEIDLNSGILTIASSAGKGISGHEDVTLNGTTVNITNATEGIESKQVLTINDGDIDVVCSDDGLNAGGGGGMPGGMRGGQPGEMPDGMPGGMRGRQPGEMPDGMPGGMRGGQPGEMPDGMPGGMRGGQPGEMPDRMPGGMRGGQPGEMPDGMPGGMRGGQPGEMPDRMPGEMRGGRGGMGGGFGGRGDNTEISSEHHIQINGGNIAVNAKGDGIDSNGSIVIDGGYIVVNGSATGNNSAVDHDGACLINGGTLIAVGSSGMIENPSGMSGQYVISAYTSKNYSAGELVSICDSAGNVIVSIAPLKSYGHIMFSSDALKEGETYTVYEGGTSTGTLDAAGGVYTGGSLKDAAAGASGTAGGDSKLIVIR